MALSHVFKGQSCYRVIVHGKEDFDALDFSLLWEFLKKYQPDIVINSISYNLVDNAETLKEKAWLMNATLPEKLADFLSSLNKYLVHFSTFLVFDGKKNSPYQENDLPSPIGFFGKSKVQGERAIIEAGLKNFLIIRTSWLFGPWRPNFVRHIIEASSRKKSLTAIHDQVGCPTYTIDLAQYTALLIKKHAQGIFHVCNTGEATWCELASEVLSILGRECRLDPITSPLYHQRAKRPPYGVLDTSKFTTYTGIRPRSWIVALRDFLFSSYCREENIKGNCL